MAYVPDYQIIDIRLIDPENIRCIGCGEYRDKGDDSRYLFLEVIDDNSNSDSSEPDADGHPGIDGLLFCPRCLTEKLAEPVLNPDRPRCDDCGLPFDWRSSHAECHTRWPAEDTEKE
jgi:hypothetical protein